MSTAIAPMDPSYANADRGPAVVSVSFVFLALSAIIIALRLYTRLAIVRSAGTEDVLIAGAWVRIPVNASFLLVADIFSIRYVVLSRSPLPLKVCMMITFTTVSKSDRLQRSNMAPVGISLHYR